MRKVKLDKRYLRVISVFFLLSFAVGVLLINILGESYADQTGIISDYYIRQYKYLDIDSQALFFYICKSRLKWVIGIWILGFTAIRRPAVFGSVTWFGFSAGILISLSILKLGTYGILFFIAAMLPQAFLYIPCWIFFLQFLYKRGSGDRQRPVRTGILKNWDWGYLLVLASAVFVLVLGILTESYMNPWIMKQILKIF